MTQWDFTSQWEGVVPFLYLDSLGNVTCGVGFLVPDRTTLERMPWKPSVADALADYSLVKAAQVGHLASWYASLVRARLSEQDMRRMFDERVADLQKLLQREWELSTLPEPARIALTDMAYNLGVGGLAKYVRLRAAVRAGDWQGAMAECHRAGVQPERNAATTCLFGDCLEPEAA